MASSIIKTKLPSFSSIFETTLDKLVSPTLTMIEMSYRETFIERLNDRSLDITEAVKKCTNVITFEFSDGMVQQINAAYLKDTALENLYKSKADTDIPSNLMLPTLYFLMCDKKAADINLSFDDTVQLYTITDAFDLSDYKEFIKSHIDHKFCRSFTYTNEIIDTACNDNTQGKVFNFMYQSLLNFHLERYKPCFTTPNCLNVIDKIKRPCCHKHASTVAIYPCAAGFNEFCCIHNSDGREKIKKSISNHIKNDKDKQKLYTDLYNEYKNLRQELKDDIIKKVVIDRHYE